MTPSQTAEIAEKLTQSNDLIIIDTKMASPDLSMLRSELLVAS